MQAEIRQLRNELIAWRERYEDTTIRSRCGIVARLLDLLSEDPTNLPLRQMTARNIARLAEAARLEPSSPESAGLGE
jgi:hypothetical protein